MERYEQILEAIAEATEMPQADVSEMLQSEQPADEQEGE